MLSMPFGRILFLRSMAKSTIGLILHLLPSVPGFFKVCIGLLTLSSPTMLLILLIHLFGLIFGSLIFHWLLNSRIWTWICMWTSFGFVMLWSKAPGISQLFFIFFVSLLNPLFLAMDWLIPMSLIIRFGIQRLTVITFRQPFTTSLMAEKPQITHGLGEEISESSLFLPDLNLLAGWWFKAKWKPMIISMLLIWARSILVFFVA